MKTHERRQKLLTLLREHRELKIAALAERLGVSQGTVRNDLNYLVENKLVRRRHGGATLAPNYPIANNGFAERARTNSTGKRAIARWAADIVKDGEAIFLDDSTTAYTMIPYLQDRRDLTIVTNGVEAALAAAQMPGITVVLLGGVLRAKTVSVFGQLSEANLESLHIKRAFLSCSGFTVETGFTETDMEIAQLKRKVTRLSAHVVALVESSKFGLVQFTSFAHVHEVTEILTDSSITPELVDHLRKATILTVCGETSMTSYTRTAAETTPYRIGFANLGEERPFAIAVRKSLEAAARDAGNIDLVTGDNQYDSRIAVRVADELISHRIDLAIEFHYEEKIGPVLMSKFNAANIPVIAVDIPILGAVYFGVDNYRAGRDGGLALGRWIKQHWRGAFDYLIVAVRPAPGPIPAARIQGQLDALTEVLGSIPPEKTITIEDNEVTTEASAARIRAVLEPLPAKSRIAVISHNDGTLEGLILAAYATKRQRHIVCVSEGMGTRGIRDELRRRNSIVVGAILFPTDQYGKGLIDLAGRILRGERVPPAVYIDHLLVDADTIDEVHPQP